MSRLGIRHTWRAVALAAAAWLTQGCYGIDPNARPVENFGKLQVVDGRLVSAVSGMRVSLHGMSLYYSNWAGAWWNESAVDQSVDYLGVWVLRAPVAVSKTDSAGKPLNAEGGYLDDQAGNLARLHAVVDQAIARGIYVIIDWHDHEAENHQAQAVEFFTQMAREYGNVPNVLFEIYNEPVTTDWGTVKSYGQAVIKAIRSTNGLDGMPTENVIIVGTPFYSQQIEKAAADPFDPSDDAAFYNIAYAFHFYSYSHSLSTFRANLETALAAKLALFATEWGTGGAGGGDVVAPDTSTEWINWMRDNEISWTNWELFDKDETCALFINGTSPIGPWDDTQLTHGCGEPYVGDHEYVDCPAAYKSYDGAYMKARLPAPNTQLFASPSLLRFKAKGGTITSGVTNKTTNAWHATAGASWISVDTSVGGAVAVTAAAHTSTTEDRSGYVYLSDDNGHDFRIKVVQHYDDGSLSDGIVPTVSSVESNSYKAAYATDGDMNTRWSSLSGDPQWIQLDLGATYTITKVVLAWEAAYSTSYHLQLASSPTGTWTDIYANTSVASGLGAHTDTIPISSTTRGRYIRMLSDKRALTSWGVSLFEFQVFGK